VFTFSLAAGQGADALTRQITDLTRWRVTVTSVGCVSATGGFAAGSAGDAAGGARRRWARSHFFMGRSHFFIRLGKS